MPEIECVFLMPDRALQVRDVHIPSSWAGRRGPLLHNCLRKARDIGAAMWAQPADKPEWHVFPVTLEVACGRTFPTREAAEMWMIFHGV